MIYLDYNATSPLRPGVKAAMEALGDAPLNTSSVHALGRVAKKHLEDARATIASALSAFPNEVLFTSSATEANNMVLRGFASTHTLLVSAVEHASISKTAALLGGAVIPVDSNGIVKLDALEQMLAALGGKPALVCVMLANNETGVIQPMADVVRIARAHGALVHCDAVQGLGKLPLDWGLLGVDMLTLTGHKAGGPVGAAALLIRNDLPIKPLLTGGGQELGRRAGTDNLRAIVGFAQTVKEVAHCPDAKLWLEWREWLAAELPDAVIVGASGEAGAPLPAGEAGFPPHHFSESNVEDDAHYSKRSGGVGNPGEGALSQADSRPHPDLQPNAVGVWANPTSPAGRGAQAAPPRLPQTLCIAMPGVKSETQIMNFDLAGFAVSAGSACSSGRIAVSPTLTAMGLAPEIAGSALRISWGWATTKAELEQFARAWKAMHQRLSKKVA